MCVCRSHTYGKISVAAAEVSIDFGVSIADYSRRKRRGSCDHDRNQ